MACSAHQLRNEDRRPCGVIARPRSRHSFDNASTVVWCPRWLGNTYPLPSLRLRACSSSANAADDSGTRCGLAVLVLSLGKVASGCSPTASRNKWLAWSARGFVWRRTAGAQDSVWDVWASASLFKPSHSGCNGALWVPEMVSGLVRRLYIQNACSGRRGPALGRASRESRADAARGDEHLTRR